MRTTRILLLAASAAALAACSESGDTPVVPGDVPVMRDVIHPIDPLDPTPASSDPDGTEAGRGSGLLGTGN